MIRASMARDSTYITLANPARTEAEPAEVLGRLKKRAAPSARPLAGGSTIYPAPPSGPPLRAAPAPLSRRPAGWG
jgi:hypothetical protein